MKKCKNCWELEEKLDDRTLNMGVIFSCIIVIMLGIIMVMPYVYNNIDENTFCLDKLNEHFPEYNFKSADYSDNSEEYKENGKCVGYYDDETYKPEQRDGLKEVIPKTLPKEKQFELTSKEDLDYMRSDDGRGVLCGFGVIFIVIAAIVLICFIMNAIGLLQ